jgi:DNA ligase-1
MKFYDFSTIHENLSKIRKRKDIALLLKNTFILLNYKEIPLFIELSLGKFEDFTKKDLNIGFNTVYEAINSLFDKNINQTFEKVEDFGEWVSLVFYNNNKLEPSSYSIEDIYNEISKFRFLKGEGVKSQRIERLRDIYKNLSYIEAKYFTKIIIKEIRGGIKEGLFKKALSLYFNIDEKKINEYFLKSGSFKRLLQNFKTKEFKIEPLKPIPMMLAEKVESIEEIYNELKNFSLEYKYDGIRVQIHKKDDDVKIFSRNLNDITENLKLIVDKVKFNFNDIKEIIVEGELIGFNKDKSILSFQDLMSLVFKKEKIDYIELDVILFDILFFNGRDLTNLTLNERIEILEKIRKNFSRSKFIIPKNKMEAENFYENSINEGYEGVIAKDLNGIYQSGRRGKLWLKLKKVETLDLVILEAYWGYGRRVNWLSDYMLYCLSEDKSRFLPLGKTFKGLSDKEFEEVTKTLLEIKEREINGGIMVKPKIVVEVGFDDIQKSKKYESGYALRFARILRFREDKNCFDINTIEDVEKIYKKLHKSK